MLLSVVKAGKEKIFLIVKKVFFTVKPKHAEGDVGFSSFSSGEVQSLACLCRKLPDVKLVIDQNSFIILDPTRIPVAGHLGWIIVVLIEKRDFELFGQVS